MTADEAENLLSTRYKYCLELKKIGLSLLVIHSLHIEQVLAPEDVIKFAADMLHLFFLRVILIFSKLNLGLYVVNQFCNF